MQQLTRATSSWILCDVTDCAVNYFPIYGGELYIYGGEAQFSFSYCECVSSMNLVVIHLGT